MAADRPLAQCGLDQTLRLAVRAGRIEPGAPVNDAERSARRAKAVRAIGRAVVGEDAADPDAVAAKPPEGPTDERADAWGAFSAERLDVGDAGMIVDGDMEGLPANAAQAMHAGAALANPVAEALHASELLHVAVQWIAGMGMFVPSGHQRRRQPAAPREDHSDAKYARLSPR